jgi:hypothetical protein
MYDISIDLMIPLKTNFSQSFFSKSLAIYLRHGRSNANVIKIRGGTATNSINIGI